MSTWKSNGYVIKLHKGDHPPMHVHVEKDGCEVAKYDIETQVFMWVDGRHRGRVLRALRAVGLAK